MVKVYGFFLEKYIKSPRKEWLRFDSLFMIMGIVLSVAVLTAAISLFEGYEKAMKESILGVNSHVYIFRPGEKNLTREDREELASFLDKQPEVITWSSVIMTQAMLVQDNKIKGCFLRGIDWEKDDLPTAYRSYVKSGTHRLEHATDIVLGYRLARSYNLKVGDSITIVNALNTEFTPLGLRPSEDTFTVVGLFESGMYEYDTKFVFMNLEAAEKFSGLKQQRSMMEVKLNPESVDSADYLAYKWEMNFNEITYRYQISSWIDFNGNLFSMLALQKWVIFIILCFLVVVASFNVISSVSASILEKQKELGILKAYGASNRFIGNMFLGKSIIIGAIATFVGIGLGVLVSLILAHQSVILLKADVYFLDRIRVNFKPVSMLIITGVSLLIVTISSYLPLRKIRAMEVTDILRKQ